MPSFHDVAASCSIHILLAVSVFWAKTPPWKLFSLCADRVQCAPCPNTPEPTCPIQVYSLEVLVGYLQEEPVTNRAWELVDRVSSLLLQVDSSDILCAPQNSRGREPSPHCLAPPAPSCRQNNGPKDVHFQSPEPVNVNFTGKRDFADGIK